MNYNFGAGPRRWSLSFPGRSTNAASIQEAHFRVLLVELCFPRCHGLGAPLTLSRLQETTETILGSGARGAPL